VDLKAAIRLRAIGIGVLGICALLLLLPMMAATKINYDSAIASTLAIGIGLLLLAELGPFVKSLKAGGMEIEFLDTVTGKFNMLETRITALEIQARHGGAAAPQALAPAKKKKTRPDALGRKITERDDPQKGRFGGKATHDGFTLSATFRNVAKNYVEIVLKVTAPREAGMDQAECVEFYLHDSFDPDVVPAIFVDGVAELTLLAYGGFTVGAWIACKDVELELDLSKVRGAPRIIRDL
jgi:hypothetical protein